MTRRPLVLSVVATVLALAGGALVAAPAQAQRPYPEKVVVRDGRTSAPAVDIAKVTLEASWYYASEQVFRIQVPNGVRTGQRYTVWFDVDLDGAPDGRYQLTIGEPRRKGGKYLRFKQVFFDGGGWNGGGRPTPCRNDEDTPVVYEVRRGERSLDASLDLWYCLGLQNPSDLDQGAWRAAVRLAKGGQSDTAPSGRRWSPVVAGWGECDSDC